MRKKYYKNKDGEWRVKRKRLPFYKWNKLRMDIWVRDRYRCVHCGIYVIFKIAHIDHILPISKGGSDAKKNLRTLCIRCHSLRKDDSHDKLRRESFEKGIIPKNFWELLWE